MVPGTVSNIQLSIHLTGLRSDGHPPGDGSLPIVTLSPVPDRDRLARLLCMVVTGLHDELDAATRRAAGCAATGPALLVVALHHPGEPVHVLADAVGLSRSGAVRALDRLEAADLVLRRDAPDHRSSLVVLTPAGSAAAQRVLNARRQVAAGVLGDLPDSLGHALLLALEQLAAALSKRGTPSDALCPPRAVSDP